MLAIIALSIVAVATTTLAIFQARYNRRLNRQAGAFVSLLATAVDDLAGAVEDLAFADRPADRAVQADINGLYAAIDEAVEYITTAPMTREAING